MAITRKRALWVMAESTYGTDPDISDGSDYTYVPTLELGLLEDQKQVLDTNYFTGRNWATAPIAGQDGWQFTMTLPLIGLSTSAGDGTNASTVTDDWLDIILTHIFGAQSTIAGEGVAAGSTTTSIVVDADPAWAEQDLAVHVQTSDSRAQWFSITSGTTTTYGMAPTQDAAPDAAETAYGSKMYRVADTGGASLAFVYQMDSSYYTLLGGRCTAASITIPTNEKATLQLTFQGNTKSNHDTNKSNMDAATFPSVTPVTGIGSPVWLNDTKYSTSTIEIDLGIQAASLESTEDTNGRGEFELIGMSPTITLHPQRTDALMQLKRAVGDTGPMMVQIGSGGGFPVNSLCIYAPAVSVVGATEEDENGRIRQAIQCRVIDEVTTNGETSVPFQIARV